MKLSLVLSVVLPLVVPLEPARQVWLFDDFESAEHVAANGLAWIALGDDLLGGTSSLVLEALPLGANGSGHALRLQGSVGAGPTAFTGAWAPLDGQSRPVDLGAFDALHFFARGEGTFQAGLRSGPPSAMANFVTSFTPGPEWKAFEIPFDRLAPVGPGSSAASWHPEEVHWLGITTAPGAHGPFHLEIDDVELVSHRPGDRAVPVARPGPARTIRLSFAAAPASTAWRELAQDPAGDGKRTSLPDAVSVALMADDGSEQVWFRIGLHDAPPLPWLGLNLAFDIDGDTWKRDAVVGREHRIPLRPPRHRLVVQDRPHVPGRGRDGGRGGRGQGGVHDKRARPAGRAGSRLARLPGGRATLGARPRRSCALPGCGRLGYGAQRRRPGYGGDPTPALIRERIGRWSCTTTS